MEKRNVVTTREKGYTSWGSMEGMEQMEEKPLKEGAEEN
jgi:hypothetical protein